MGGSSSVSLPLHDVALWNPDNLSLWNLVFTPAFGGWIQARNWSALGEDKRAKESMYWFFGILNLLAWMMPFLPLADMIAAIFIVNGIWHFAFSKLHETYVKEKIGSAYEHKSWRQPLSVATACLLLLVVFKLSLASKVCR